ncbi:major facilitator superfamily domain-containing protein [Talaromyces proteolyticus]|uniref:Major facilitator superfamily domain-containing protein n=1 Tax=Talaromyces proteolyticus TaxID=1131652 RepID=A0AAD4L286_9EURO|nr:major facilitator superfamily domain-containing protein [Talaromyces proteolyticus]KAH8705839.1 major facilitator superfamily domain-containing protein [Talaromyces proteolyticus]
MSNDKPDNAVFSLAEERRLVRKLDIWIVPLMMVTYTLQCYDKGIMSAATQFNFNADLGLTTIVGYETNGTPITNNQKYSNASMIFYVGYLVGTYPMVYLSQHYRTSHVISLATMLWGAVVMSTAVCFNYAGIMVNRFMLGLLESAVAPTFTVLVTFWWTREEQALRTGLWYCCVGVATTISPLINYGLGQIHGSLDSWKPMFLLLGAVTTMWSVVLFFALPDSPLTTKGLTESERKIAIQRLQQNQAGTISHVFNRVQLFEAFRDYKMYSCALIILLTGVPSGALGTFGTIVINSFGFSHFDSLALTCPIGAITAFSILLVGYITRKLNGTRYLCIVICALISIAGTLICWFGPRNNRGLLFAGILLTAVQVAAGGLAVSLAASNIAGHTKKATTSASTFVGYCIGNIIGPLIFGASPGPLYRAGFIGSFVCLCGVVVIGSGTYLLLRRENAKRNGELIRVGGTQQDSIEENLTDMQNKEFRYML